VLALRAFAGSARSARNNQIMSWVSAYQNGGIVSTKPQWASFGSGGSGGGGGGGKPPWRPPPNSPALWRTPRKGRTERTRWGYLTWEFVHRANMILGPALMQWLGNDRYNVVVGLLDHLGRRHGELLGCRAGRGLDPNEQDDDLRILIFVATELGWQRYLNELFEEIGLPRVFRPQKHA
jgi:hypothetical protein